MNLAIHLSTNPFITYGINKLCTICHVILKDTDSTYSIFCKLEELELESPKNVIQLLQSFSNFNNYNGPQHLVCNTCYHKTFEVYKFIQMCNKAYENIQNYLKYEEEIQTRTEGEMNELDVNLKVEVEEILISPTKILSDGQKLVEEMENNETNRNEEITIYPLENVEVENDNTNTVHIDTKHHSKDRPFICKQCGKAFNFSTNLIRHLKIHTNERPYKCEICNKTFGRPESLKRHETIHSTDRPQRLFICQQCGQAFKLSITLKNHLAIHAGEKPEYKCQICNKSFSHLGNFHNHKRAHSKDRPFICKQCGKAFNFSTNLIRHLKIHTKERPYKCEICNKTFGRPESLKRHESIHDSSYEREKPYKCEICNKAFENTSNFYSHKKTHSKDRPFSCNHCDKAFKWSANLTRHLKIHTKETPTCNKAFARPESLQRHENTH